MSSAHRPTWNPAKGSADTAHVSKVVGARQLPSQTKLKFRQPQQGFLSRQANAPITSVSDLERRRDLKRQLEAAEREARNQKRKAQGLEPEVVPEEGEEDVKPKGIGAASDASEAGGADGEEAKRRKILAEAVELDRDDDASDNDDDVASRNGDSEAVGGRNGKANGEPGRHGNGADASDSSDDSSSSDDDDEDETAALLRELEKIKRERAEEKARQERERDEAQQSSREDEIALGNPLLNLENAMKGAGAGAAGARKMTAADFGVKRRWDDDVIFKNQAAGNDGGDKSGFVNDLARSEFHKRFLYRYIK